MSARLRVYATTVTGIRTLVATRSPGSPSLDIARHRMLFSITLIDLTNIISPIMFTRSVASAGRASHVTMRPLIARRHMASACTGDRFRCAPANSRIRRL